MIWRWFGRMPYREMLAWQTARREEIVAGGREILALVEHPRVITVGRRPVEGLADLDIDVVHTNRGGLATWHGPGQLVAYPLVDLHRRGLRVREAVRGLEDALVAVGAELDVPIERDPSRPGAWVGERKIASVGLHVRHGVVMHGLALNVDCDLTDFDLFTPCGLDGVRMTRLSEHGCRRSVEQIAPMIAGAIARALTPSGRPITR